MAKTFDLSTLQLSAGTHTIQVKARATGFKDSNFSNSVSYIVASGFNLIAGQNGFNTGYNEFLGSGNALEYSLDNGSTWQSFNKNFAANETILTGITQIKFRISKAPMTHGADSYEISSTKLNLYMSIQGSSTESSTTSNNFVLTENIDDLYGSSFVD